MDIQECAPAHNQFGLGAANWQEDSFFETYRACKRLATDFENLLTGDLVTPEVMRLLEEMRDQAVSLRKQVHVMPDSIKIIMRYTPPAAEKQKLRRSSRIATLALRPKVLSQDAPKGPDSKRRTHKRPVSYYPLGRVAKHLCQLRRTQSRSTRYLQLSREILSVQFERMGVRFEKMGSQSATPRDMPSPAERAKRQKLSWRKNGEMSKVSMSMGRRIQCAYRCWKERRGFVTVTRGPRYPWARYDAVPFVTPGRHRCEASTQARVQMNGTSSCLLTVMNADDILGQEEA